MAKINWDNPSLNQLSPEKLQLLKLISSDLESMDTNTAFSYILALNTKLKEQNISFSTTEYNILLSAIVGDVPDIFKSLFH